MNKNIKTGLAILLVVSTAITLPLLFNILLHDTPAAASPPNDDDWTDGPGDANNTSYKIGSISNSPQPNFLYFSLWAADEDENLTLTNFSNRQYNPNGSVGTSYPNPNNTSVPLSGLTRWFQGMDVIDEKARVSAYESLAGKAEDEANEFLKSSGEDYSYYPQNKTTKDNGMIKDAYIDVLSTNGIKVKYSSGHPDLHFTDTKTRTSRKKLGALVAVDFSVDTSKRTNIGQTVDDGDDKYFYDFLGYEISEVRLVEQKGCNSPSCVIDTSSNRMGEDQALYENYRNPNDYGWDAGVYYFQVDIEAKINVEHHEYDDADYDYRDIDNDTETEPVLVDPAGWEGPDYYNTTRSVTVHDKIGTAVSSNYFPRYEMAVYPEEVSNPDLENATKRLRFKFGSGNQNTGYDTYWSYVNIEGDGMARSQFDFYSQRSTASVNMIKEKWNGSKEGYGTPDFVSPQIHAYANSHGPRALNNEFKDTLDEELLYTHSSGYFYAPKGIHPDVQSNETSASWGPTDTFMAQYEEVGMAPNITMHRFASSKTVSCATNPYLCQPSKTVVVGKPEIDVTVTNITNRTYGKTVFLNINVTDKKTGEPIKTASNSHNSGAYLLIKADKPQNYPAQNYPLQQTNKSGISTPIIPTDGQTIKVIYVPQDWWTHNESGPGKAYRRSSETISIYSTQSNHGPNIFIQMLNAWLYPIAIVGSVLAFAHYVSMAIFGFNLFRYVKQLVGKLEPW